MAAEQESAISYTIGGSLERLHLQGRILVEATGSHGDAVKQVARILNPSDSMTLASDGGRTKPWFIDAYPEHPDADLLYYQGIRNEKAAATTETNANVVFSLQQHEQITSPSTTTNEGNNTPKPVTLTVVYAASAPSVERSAAVHSGHDQGLARAA